MDMMTSRLSPASLVSSPRTHTNIPLLVLINCKENVLRMLDRVKLVAMTSVTSYKRQTLSYLYNVLIQEIKFTNYKEVQQKSDECQTLLFKRFIWFGSVKYGWTTWGFTEWMVIGFVRDRTHQISCLSFKHLWHRSCLVDRLLNGLAAWGLRKSTIAFSSQNILDSNYLPSFFFGYSIIYLIDIF